MGQMATALNELKQQNSGTIPAQLVSNPLGNVSAISLRNEREVESSNKEDSIRQKLSNSDEKSDSEKSISKVPIPFPLGTVKLNKLELD